MAKKDKAAAPAEATKKEEKVTSDKPQKPDDKVRDAAIDKIKAQQNELKVKQDSLKAKIDKAQAGKEEYQQERTLMWDKLKKIDEERKALKEQRATLLGHFKSEKEEEKKMKKMSKEAGEMNEEKIDQKLREIEYKMSTQSMSLKEEKDLMVEIKKLKSKRPEAARKAAELEALEANKKATALPEGVNMQEQLDAVKAQIEQLNNAHNEQYDQINAHKEQRDQKLSGSKDLIDARNGLRDQIQGFRDSIDKIWGQWKEDSKKFNEWEKDQRKAQQAKRQAEWDAQQAEWDAVAAEKELEQPSPFIEQIIKLDQAIQFCKELVPKEKVDATVELKQFDAPDGMPSGATCLRKKDERDSFFTVAPKGKKNLRKKADKVKSNAIKHSGDSLQTFKNVEVPAPVTTAELPATLEQLNAKLEELNKKTADWEAERKKKIEEAKAAKADGATEEKVAEAEVA